MKAFHFLQILLLAFVLHSCVGANYYLKQGNYEAAISSAISKLRKNPKKADKQILALEQAWKIKSSESLNEIETLKIQGNPESWLRIHQLYNELDKIQSAIEVYLPLFIKKEFRNADIELIDVKQELADAKLKAASYLYAQGELKLAKNSKQSAREAYYNFCDVRAIFGNFKDVDTKIDEAYALGQNHILIGYSNHSLMIIPEEFMNNLARFDENLLNGNWTNYHLNASDRSSYDYLIEVHINLVEIGPEQISNTSYQDKKKIQDGFTYVLDDKGNVEKDSLGNDIKVPAFKEITATVFRTEQTKVGILGGIVEFKRGSGQVFQSVPFQENLVFKNFYATFQGDRNALSKESKNIIGGNPLPFPSNLQMVMDASELIKKKSYAIISNNEALVLN
ncbi:MAG: hypothetical protein KDC82_03960 [Bacteroidetes bacterium]|nr:hypothetical protein [Bacteroidota bacterium]